MSIIDAVRLHIAAGAMAVMTEGTELGGREDTQRLYQELTESSVRGPIYAVTEIADYPVGGRDRA